MDKVAKPQTAPNLAIGPAGRAGSAGLSLPGQGVRDGTKLSIVILLLLTLLPFQPEIAGINLIPYRLYLLATAVPYAAMLASGQGAG